MAYSSTSLPEVDAYDVNKYIISPLFLGGDWMSYMDVIPDIKGKTVIDNFGKLNGKTTGFNAGAAFAGASAAIGSGITIDPTRMEIELQFQANLLFGKIKGNLMRSNVDYDNIDGTIVKQALLELLGKGAAYDFNQQMFMSGAHLTDSAGFVNNYDGLFVASFDAKDSTQKAATVLDSTDVTDLTNDAALVAGKGIEILKAMYAAAPAELLDAEGRVFMVTGSIADDYQATLEADGYAAAGYGAVTDGAKMSFRGIPLEVRRDWDSHIAASGHAKLPFAGHANENYAAMLTCRNAFVVGTDFDSTQVEQWYSLDNKAYRFRISYMTGVALTNPDLCVTFTPDQIVSA